MEVRPGKRLSSRSSYCDSCPAPDRWEVTRRCTFSIIMPTMSAGLRKQSVSASSGLLQHVVKSAGTKSTRLDPVEQGCPASGQKKELTYPEDAPQGTWNSFAAIRERRVKKTTFRARANTSPPTRVAQEAIAGEERSQRALGQQVRKEGPRTLRLSSPD